jgi:hypothetical protein
VCEQFGGRYGARVHHLREGLALTKGRGKNHG